MGLLEGTTAVVTGGGSGIGRATCRRMAEEGARVAVVDLDGDAAEAVAKEIDGIAFAIDVGDPEAVRAAVDDAAAQLGGLSVIYNNAGTSAFGRMHEIEPAEWDRVCTSTSPACGRASGRRRRTCWRAGVDRS